MLLEVNAGYSNPTSAGLPARPSLQVPNALHTQPAKSAAAFSLNGQGQRNADQLYNPLPNGTGSHRMVLKGSQPAGLQPVHPFAAASSAELPSKPGVRQIQRLRAGYFVPPRKVARPDANQPAPDCSVKAQHSRAAGIQQSVPSRNMTRLEDADPGPSGTREVQHSRSSHAQQSVDIKPDPAGRSNHSAALSLRKPTHAASSPQIIAQPGPQISGRPQAGCSSHVGSRIGEQPHHGHDMDEGVHTARAASKAGQLQGLGQCARNRAAAGQPLARRRLVKATPTALPDTQLYPAPPLSLPPSSVPSSLTAEAKHLGPNAIPGSPDAASGFLPQQAASADAKPEPLSADVIPDSSNAAFSSPHGLKASSGAKSKPLNSNGKIGTIVPDSPPAAGASPDSSPGPLVSHPSGDSPSMSLDSANNPSGSKRRRLSCKQGTWSLEEDAATGTSKPRRRRRLLQPPREESRPPASDLLEARGTSMRWPALQDTASSGPECCANCTILSLTS